MCTLFTLQQEGEIARKLSAGDDAAAASWHPLDNLPELAFDHMSIIQASWSKCVFRTSPQKDVIVVDKSTDTKLNSFRDGVVDSKALSRLVLST